MGGAITRGRLPAPAGRRRRRVRRTSLNCTMKSLVYLITSSELRRLDADSEGACAGRGGELPIDRQGGARKRTKSCREGLRGRARSSATAARRRGRADLERSPCPRAYLRPGSHGEAGEGSRGGPRAPRAEGDGFHRRSLARRALGGGHEKSAESLRRGANSVPKRPTNDTRGRRSGAGRVLRGRLDLPSARTRPEAATNAARRVTSHRRKPTRARPPVISSRAEPRVLPNLRMMHGMHETNGPRV